MSLLRWMGLSLAAFGLLACSDSPPSRSPDPAVAAAATPGLPLLDGEALFAIACAGCHRIEAVSAHDVGPNLHGIVGRPAAGQPGYAYSAALQASALVWDRGSLAGWIAATEVLVPGTTMTYANILSADEVARVVDYLFGVARGAEPVKLEPDD